MCIRLSCGGVQVLYLVEPIDEVAIQNLGVFEGKTLVDVTRENLTLEDSEEEKKAAEEVAASLRPLTDFMAKVLGDAVEKVSVSGRLAETPAAVVTSQFGWSANMERIMRSQVGSL